jgi:FAD/FMN-containing dehydrogenase
LGPSDIVVTGQGYLGLMDHAGTAPLEHTLQGRLIRPGDPDYDEARRTFNGLVDKHPLAIARCSTPDEVAAVVAFARDASLPLGVRGGGHSVAGTAMVEGGVVADLSPAREVRVDPERLVAHVGGGALWQDLDPAALQRGLAVPGGVYGDTGVGGLTLGGGIGFLMGIGGFSCDNLVGAQVVTADGTIVEAADDTELLWALRGGGGNFGAVTRFDLSLHEIGPMYGGKVDLPLGDGAILRRWRSVMRDGPDELLVMPIVARADDGTPIVQLQFSFMGPAGDGERLAAAIIGSAAPARAALRTCTYLDIQAINEIKPFGRRNYWSSTFVIDLDDALVDLLVAEAPKIPAVSGFLIEPVHGAARRFGPEHAAFANRSARVHVSAIGIWEDPAFDQAGMAWSRSMTERISAWSAGGLYANYSMPGEAATARPTERARAAYPPDVYLRLQMVKRRYDPTNLFRSNLNITPADG